MTVNYAMVGCGGMGLRHAMGYIEARRTFESLHLGAVCDLHEAAASRLADEVEKATGRRPKVYTDFSKMIEQERGLDAVEVVTDTRMHHAFALQALHAGKHVMTEKPIALTVQAAQAMADAAKRAGRTLAVAENYRRDPMNRLGRALIEAGAIGEPYFALDIAVSGSEGVMHGTAWRAKKSTAGGIVLDAGVHNADLLLYFMGDADTVYAETGVMRPARELKSMTQMHSNLAKFYVHREQAEARPQGAIEQDAVDTALAVIRFRSGAIGQFTMTDSSLGYRLGVETIQGSAGTLVRSPSRSGKGPEVRRQDGSVVKGDDLLKLVPDWELDGKTAALWGGKRRMASYEMPFEEIDRKIIAIEYQDFVEAVEDGREPEVGPEGGMKALALLYAVLESGETGKPVKIGDVISGKVSAYQREINATGLR